MTFPLPAFGFYEYPALVVRNYLVTRVPNTYTIATQIPVPKPANLIVVHGLKGGRMLTPIHSWRRMIVWIYGMTESGTAQAAEYVRGYVFESQFQYGSGIRGVQLQGEPYKHTDPDDPEKTDRFEFSCDVLVRAKTGPNAGGSLTPPPGPSSPSGAPTGYFWIIGEDLGIADGVTAVFSTNYIYLANQIMVYVNGVREIYFTQTTSDTITLDYTPPEGTIVTADYLTNEGGS